MGQIISFPRPQILYPVLTANIHKAECVLLLATRWWVTCFRREEDPLPRLRLGLAFAGAEDAALSIDGLMTIVGRAVRRPLNIRPPRCRDLSHDETHLLQAAGLVQAGDIRLAERVLRTTLLSAAGAEFALGPLESLGVLFARAGLLLSPWRLAEPARLSRPGAELEL